MLPPLPIFALWLMCLVPSLESFAQTKVRNISFYVSCKYFIILDLMFKSYIHFKDLSFFFFFTFVWCADVCACVCMELPEVKCHSSGVF